MKYIFFALFFLTACTKRSPEEIETLSEVEVIVMQSKVQVMIDVKLEPKPYMRVLTVVCQFSGQEFGTTFIIYPDITEVHSRFTTTNLLTGYYISTFGRYHE